MLNENSRRRHQLFTAILYPGIGFVNSNTTTGLDVCLYDEGRGSRSTGKERDAESGLDYFGARYYGAALGRFTSPDWSAKPAALPYAKLDNPQTLNLYAYVGNNPLSRNDPDGHEDKPTQEQVIRELNRLADSYNVPAPIMRAVAKTESNFNTSEVSENKNSKGTVTSTDYGLMQINSKNIGSTTIGTDNKPLKITDDVKTDWKENAKVGAGMVAEAYKRAVKEQPNGTEETRAEQTYSQYNAGPGDRTRYQERDANGNFADVRDKRFLDNYHSEQNRKDKNP